MGGDAYRRVEFWQIRASAQARAHYYVDIAHRSSLLYAPASLILAVLAYFCIWDATVILMCVILNLVFFSFSIGFWVVYVGRCMVFNRNLCGIS